MPSSHSPTATSSTFTASASEGPRTPPSSSLFRRPGPRQIRPESNALRASVFNVFLELGALEENSQIAEWMFNDSDASTSDVQSDTDHPSRSPKKVMFREQTGSRFRERLDSEGAGGLLDSVKWSTPNSVSAMPPSMPPSVPMSPTHSKASRFFGRVAPRPMSKYNGVDDRRERSANLGATSHISSPIKKRPFVMFRSKSANLKPEVEAIPERYSVDQDAPLKELLGGIPSDPFSSPRPALPPRAKSSPSTHVPSPSCTGTDDGWEKVTRTPTMDFVTSTTAPNPFLHGNGKSAGFPFPSGENTSKDATILKRLSTVVSRPFLHPDSAQHNPNERHSFLSLRRTRSRPPERMKASRPSLPLRANYSSYSGPVSHDDSHALTTTMSH